MQPSPYAEASPQLPLYERLAGQIRQQIEAGAYQPGHRLPSVRQASSEHNLSVTTVLQAYQVLENQGWIEARPQSGYYVRPRSAPAVLEPETSCPPDHPCEVSVEELVRRVLHDSTNPNLVQFGAAIPAPELLPTQRLKRILAGLLRQEDVRQYSCGIPEGVEELRVQVAQCILRAGVVISPDDLLITNGALEALNLSMQAVCRPGDLVAVESPTYFGILQIMEAQGLRVLEIPTHQRDGISLEALRFAIEHHPVKAAILVTNFSNPLGSCMPDENKRQLVEMLAERDIPLIEDDLYGQLHFDEQRPRVAKSYDSRGNVLLCSSFCKDISPSLRVGWLVPGRYFQRIARLKMNLNLGTALLPQLAVAHYLSSGGYEHHLRRLRRTYAEKVSLMADAVQRYFPAGTNVTRPRGGFVLWVQLPEQVDSLVLYNQAVQAGITITPGHLFSAGDKYRNYIRLNAAYWSYQSLAALQRLAGLVEKLAG